MSRKRSGKRRDRAPRIKRWTEPGAAPGTLAGPPDAVPLDLRVFQYAAEQLTERKVVSIDELAGIDRRGVVTWVDTDGLGNGETLAEVGAIFGLHPLALEDVLHVHQRAKVEEYGDHLFIVTHMVTRNSQLESEQLSLFLGRDYVLTFQERPGDCLGPVRDRLRKGHGRIRKCGADYLAYSLIDAVVDAYFPIVDQYGEQMEELDEQIGEASSSTLIRGVHDLRNDLMFLRRVIRPLRDALLRLSPDPHALIGEETQFHLRDCYDHTVQLIDLLDTYREMCSDLRDFHLSSVSNRMNEIMKFLTIISTIFIPLSFVTGIYGMNFNPQVRGNMPELNWPFFYPGVLATMALIAVGLLAYFWRRGWLADDTGVTRGKK